MREFPKPEDKEEKSKEQISPESVTYVIQSTLRPAYRDDPTVLAYINSYLACRDNRQASLAANIDGHAGRRLLNKRDVRATIDRLTQTQIKQFGIDPHALVERVKEVAEVDIAELEEEDGSYKTSLRSLSPEFRRAIRKFKVKNTYDKDPNGISIKTGEIIEVEMWDKMKSIELLGRETGNFKETKVVEHDVSKNMKNVLLESRKRAEEDIKNLSSGNKEIIDV